MLDDHDQIEWCNAISEQHFGLDAKRDLRQHITHLVRQPDFVRYLNSNRYEEMLIMRGMGSSRQNVISVQVFPYGDNRKLVLTQDITELERTDAMRRDFVANVSHELKTPLTVLSGFLETMRELPLSESERARYLELMEQQAARMRHIVTDLLVLAQLEGEARLQGDQMVDMRAVLCHVREDAENLSGGHHKITADFDDSLSVTGSETEVLSALGNLATNAVRYTPDGGTVHLSWRAEGNCAVFSVTDSGLGIPAADIPRLTERFYRVDRSRSRDTGGTGLGLAIVKHVLQRHDAVLEVKSEEGRGSTFTVRFPATRAARRHPDTRQTPDRAALRRQSPTDLDARSRRFASRVARPASRRPAPCSRTGRRRRRSFLRQNPIDRPPRTPHGRLRSSIAPSRESSRRRRCRRACAARWRAPHDDS